MPSSNVLFKRVLAPREDEPPTKIPNIPHCLPPACLSTGYGKHEGRPRCHMSVSPWGSTGLSPVTESCVSRYMGLDASWWRRYGRLHTAGAGERRRDCVGLEPRALHTRTDTRLHAGQRGDPEKSWGGNAGLGTREQQVGGKKHTDTGNRSTCILVS